MLKCDRCESLLMRHFDGDLKGRERRDLDKHLDSCPDCRLLFSELTGVLDALENARSPEPEPELQRLVMDRVMTLAAPAEKSQHSLAGMVCGFVVGIVAFMLAVLTMTVQENGFGGLVLSAREYLDTLSGFVMDMQIVYRIAAGLFPAEVFSLFLSIQSAFITAILLLAVVMMKTAFRRRTGECSSVL